VKLLLDEMYPSLIARELRARGHDVLSAHETPGRGTPDEELFDHARADGRAVVTENIRDYRPLAERVIAAGGNHAGLVFTSPGRWPRNDPGRLIKAIADVLRSTARQPIDMEIWL
jgi:uncharacterized protein DUF5615